MSVLSTSESDTVFRVHIRMFCNQTGILPLVDTIAILMPALGSFGLKIKLVGLHSSFLQRGPKVIAYPLLRVPREAGARNICFGDAHPAHMSRKCYTQDLRMMCVMSPAYHANVARTSRARSAQQGILLWTALYIWNSIKKLAETILWTRDPRCTASVSTNGVELLATARSPSPKWYLPFQ
jgi:hypothetical protein